MHECFEGERGGRTVRKCRPGIWSRVVELDEGEGEKVEGDGKPEDGDHVPRRTRETFQIGGSKESSRLSEMARLVDLAEVE